MSDQALRWGIIGTGNIAKQFAAGMVSARRGSVVAVGSRTQAAANAFSAPFSIRTAHPTYEALLADRNVDAVYLSLPNSMHHEWTLRALRAGKHVLCEKPFSVTSAEAQEMFDVATKMGRVLVEAFMYRSHPQTDAIRKTIADGAIGAVKLIRTSFCYRTTRVADNIRFDPALAGGAMMDIGCYCLDFSRLIAGAEPISISAYGALHPTGVDEMAGGTLTFSGGVLASFVCGMGVQHDNTAMICGSEGYLSIGWPWKPPRRATFSICHSTPPRQEAKTGQTPLRPPTEEVTVEADAELYALEADDFAAVVFDRAAPAVTANQTLGNMRCLESIRRQIGLSF